MVEFLQTKIKQEYKSKTISQKIEQHRWQLTKLPFWIELNVINLIHFTILDIKFVLWQKWNILFQTFFGQNNAMCLIEVPKWGAPNQNFVVLPDLPAKMGTGTRSTNQQTTLPFGFQWFGNLAQDSAEFADSQVGWLCFFFFVRTKIRNIRRSRCQLEQPFHYAGAKPT